MSTVTTLQDLAQHIRQQEAELARLRKEHEKRHAKLTKLTRKKQTLEKKLHQIEAEIQEVGHVSTSAPAAATAPVAVARPAPTAAPKPAKGVKLPHLLVSMVAEAKRPISVKELTEELVRRRFPTTSKDLQGMVQTRVYDLIKKGLVRKSADQTGLIAGKAALGMNAAPAKAPAEGKKVAAKPAQPTGSTRGQSLREALKSVLAKSSRPLSAQELADRVLASGYESASKDLKNVIWVSIGKIEGIERVPGIGYQLKRGK